MHKFSVFLVLVAGTCWGTSGFFATTLRQYGFDALQMALMRNIISTVCLFAFCAMFRRDKLKMPPKRLLLIGLSAFGLYGTGAFYYAAMKAASISIAVVLMYLAPVIVMTYSVIFMKERFTYVKFACAVAALVGTGLVTGIIGGHKVSLVGIGLGLMSGISYSLYNICAKYEMKRGDDPVVSTTYCFAFATVVSFVFGSPVETCSMVCAEGVRILPWVIALGLITSTLPYIVYTYAMKRLPAGVTASIGSVEPLVATLISVALYNEPITWSSCVGIALIIIAVIVLSTEKE